jgi:hypothetical protein
VGADAQAAAPRITTDRAPRTASASSTTATERGMKMTDLSNSADGPPNLTEIEDIVQVADPAEMNKKITNAYYRLSLAAQKALNAGPNLDWCGFAKLASHTVGRDLDPNKTGSRTVGTADVTVQAVNSILDHPVLRGLLLLHPQLEQEIDAAIHDAVEDLVRNDVNVEDRLAAKALRASNALIFGEIGSVFVRLLERLGEPGATLPQSEESIHKIAHDIDEGVATPQIFLDAPIDTTMFEAPQGKFLVWAVDFYLRAAQETDQVRKGELMLAGSIMFTQYEQQRADRLITIGTCVPIRAKLIDFLNSRLPGPEVPRLELLLAKRGSINDVPSHLSPTMLKMHLFDLENFAREEKTKLMTHIISLTEEELISALTKHVLFLEIAQQRVPLGLPEQLPHDPPVPLIVPKLPEVKAVMAVLNSAAEPNWIDLQYRLEFIGKYFAAFQLDPQTQQNPETDTQQNPGTRGEPPPPV